MICASCQSEIGGEKKFCGRCGAAAPATPRCSKCESEILPGKKFCGVCGAAVLEQPSPAPSRVLVPAPVPPKENCRYCGARLVAAPSFVDSAES